MSTARFTSPSGRPRVSGDGGAASLPLPLPVPAVSAFAGRSGRMSVEHFRRLVGFNAWANDRVCDSVASLPDEACRASRGAFFGSIHNTLTHLRVVDRL